MGASDAIAIVDLDGTNTRCAMATGYHYGWHRGSARLPNAHVSAA
jgi:hypothetical protein